MIERLTACISGSFKFKPEIDELHDEFADLGVDVLEPTKGWLYIPTAMYRTADAFRPLPLERGMSAQEVERRFLTALKISDFLYINNMFDYIGTATALEMGYAHGNDKPIFAKQAVTLQNFDYDLAAYAYWNNGITVATPEEAVHTINLL